MTGCYDVVPAPTMASSRRGGADIETAPPGGAAAVCDDRPVSCSWRDRATVTMAPRRRLARSRWLAVLVVAIVLAGCGATGSASSPSSSPTPGPSSRPASTARITILSPTPGEVVSGSVVHVVIGLTGAHVVAQTTTHIRPDEGHVHLYLDNQLISMQYALEQDIPVKPGVYTLRAEFVAADHFPFNPRVFSPTVVFTVR